MGLTRPTVAQLNTVVTEISDPISVLNKGSTLANIDVGFILNRDGGISSNAAIIWQESSDQFVLGLTANTGAVFANIVISEFANLRVNRLTGANIDITGNASARFFYGNGSQLTGIITSVTKLINGTSDITAYDSGNIAVSVAGFANTVVFTSSNIQVTGSIIPTANITYDLGSPTNRWRSAYFSGNTVYIGDESVSVATNGTWTFTSDGASVNLGANAEFNPPSANISGNVTARYFYGNGSQLTGIRSFSNVFVDGHSPVLADNNSDTLTFVGGTGIAITTDAANDSITFSTVSTTGPFAQDADFGLVTDAVAVSDDLGDLASTSSTSYDLESLVEASGLIYPDLLVLPSYDTPSLPGAAIPAQLIYNTTTQSLAYTDGNSWNNMVGGYSNVQVATYLPTHSGAVQSSNIQTTTANIQASTAATNTATGALRVIGGAGVAGTVFAGNFNTPGNVLASGAVFSSVNVNGNITVTSAYIIPSANAASSLGTSATRWNFVFGVNGNFQSVNANYADLAERFESDAPMLPGTVVMLGGIKEITAVVKELCEDVFGVISTKAAFLMNGQAGPDNTHPPVAVNGRVPVRVIGQVKKGDRLVSAGGGLARSAKKSEVTPFNVIGRALEDKFTVTEGIVEAIVKLNF